MWAYFVIMGQQWFIASLSEFSYRYGSVQNWTLGNCPATPALVLICSQHLLAWD